MEASFSAGAICSRETARAAPGIALSKREQQVLHWAAEGSEWGIGLILGLSEHTVEKFIQSARIKLPRCEANACRGQAVRLRLVASDPPLTRSCRDQKKAGRSQHLHQLWWYPVTVHGIRFTKQNKVRDAYFAKFLQVCFSSSSAG